jgi:hypothetical protein
MAPKIYRSPDGYQFQYEEGTQPAGYVLVTAEKPKAAPKRRATANKKRTTDNK